MAKPRYSSNAGIFARRGDPWVSDREGREKFGRNVETEDPDFDQFFAHKAVPKVEFREARPEPKKNDYSKRKASIIHQMNKEMRQAQARTIVVDSVTRGFKPCPSCRKAACIAKKTCLINVR